MKQVLLTRHCKSDWKFEELSDHDRPLNTRGKSDIPKIVARLAILKPELEKVYHSTAKRAADTATSIFGQLDRALPIEALQDLYTFSSDEVAEVIRSFPEGQSAVAVVGHNPGLTDFIREYTKIRLDNLPTGGFCLIEFDVSHWSEIAENSGEVQFLEYPKMLK